MSDGSGVERVDLEKVDWRGSREFFESLGDALDKLDDHDESYDFTWVGKRKSIIEAGAPINKTLRPDVENSKNWDTTKNLFIEGDNLDALKLLQESYLGKVKMIYIDPPYNTGNNLIYKNDFSVGASEYEIESGQYDEEQGRLVANTESNGRFHSDWCSMFYSRVKVARNLIRNDGYFVCAMDDSEIVNTIKICDEVFGEENCLGIVTVVHKPEGRNQEKFFGTSNEFAVFYAKDKSISNFNNVVLDPELAKKYSDTDENGNYRLQNFIRLTDGKLALRSVRPKFWYPIYVNPSTLKVSVTNQADYIPVYPTTKAGVEMSWKTLPGTLETSLSAGNIVAAKDNEGFITVYEKIRETQVIKTHWVRKEYNAIQYGTKIVNELLGGKYFDFPKSLYLVQDILKLTTNDSDLILDFFSGSATTAHAVMQLNAEDGGNRKWIMVQLPEETDGKSEAFKAGYKTIPEISRERIRRAGDKIASEHPDAKVDYGFRALRIDDTNHKDVYRPAADYQQNMLDDLVENVKEDRSALDLLYGVLSQSAFELNRPMETIQIDTGATLYKYDYFGEVSGLVACFDGEVTEETIKQIAQLKPLTAVFREDSFPNSQAKVNLAEHFRIISPDTKVKVI